MWTALMVKESAPEMQVAVIEQKCCGYGASGSNGGCLLTLSAKYMTLAKLYGEAEAKKFAGTQDLLEGFFSPSAGSVQPALLVRGMAAVARKMGVRIYEQPPMLELNKGNPPEIQTPNGRIKAKKIVLAMNAWMASRFKQFSRSIAVVSSDMAVTAPCSEKLYALGLTHGATICDSRIFVHYFHTTPDGRLMMGKGGNTFAYNSRMQPSFFQESRYKDQLHHFYLSALSK